MMVIWKIHMPNSRQGGFRWRKSPQAEAANHAFSERYLRIAKNAPFSPKIATFSIRFVQTARRSRIQNDGLSIFSGAVDSR
jgi:hypothetical protein